MKAQFFDALSFGFSWVSSSEYIQAPEIISPENSSLLVEECLVVLFHVEEGDGEKQKKRLLKDVQKFFFELGAMRLVIAAFGHISHSYAPPDVALELSKQIVSSAHELLPNVEVYTSPFGHNKTFDLKCKGHQKAIRYREYRS